VEVIEPNPDLLLGIVHAILGYDIYKLSADDQKDLLSRIFQPLQNEVGAAGDGRLFVVKGNLPGTDTIQAGDATQDVVVVSPRPEGSYVVSFKFILVPEAVPDTASSDPNFNSDMEKYRWRLEQHLWTRHTASEVDAWISKLNWIFGSQTNSTFDLGTAKPLPIKKLSFVKTDNDADEFNNYRDPGADFTVILCGDQLEIRNDSGHPRPLALTWQPDDGGSWVTITKDNPKRDGDVAADHFVLALAHELSHAVQQDHKNTHFCEEGFLRSRKRQTTMIGDVLRPLLVNPGTPPKDGQVCGDT
jgi:hypothetical protein